MEKNSSKHRRVKEMRKTDKQNALSEATIIRHNNIEENSQKLINNLDKLSWENTQNAQTSAYLLLDLSQTQSHYSKGSEEHKSAMDELFREIFNKNSIESEGAKTIKLDCAENLEELILRELNSSITNNNDLMKILLKSEKNSLMGRVQKLVKKNAEISKSLLSNIEKVFSENKALKKDAVNLKKDVDELKLKETLNDILREINIDKNSNNNNKVIINNSNYIDNSISLYFESEIESVYKKNISNSSFTTNDSKKKQNFKAEMEKLKEKLSSANDQISQVSSKLKDSENLRSQTEKENKKLVKECSKLKSLFNDNFDLIETTNTRFMLEIFIDAIYQGEERPIATKLKNIFKNLNELVNNKTMNLKGFSQNLYIKQEILRSLPQEVIDFFKDMNNEKLEDLESKFKNCRNTLYNKGGASKNRIIYLPQNTKPLAKMIESILILFSEKINFKFY